MDIGDHAVKMHWTDAGYHWHTNTGQELFVVLDGKVRMFWRSADDAEQFRDLECGDVMLFEEGDAHRAEPLPQARVLVIERKDSD